MASYAFANRLHVMRKAFVDLDAAEPRRWPSLSRDTAAQSLNLRLVAKPLRIQNKRNGAHGAAFLRRPCLYPAIHCIGYVQCRSHGNDYTKSLYRNAIWIYGFMHATHHPNEKESPPRWRRDGALRSGDLGDIRPWNQAVAPSSRIVILHLAKTPWPRSILASYSPTSRSDSSREN